MLVLSKLTKYSKYGFLGSATIGALILAYSVSYKKKNKKLGKSIDEVLSLSSDNETVKQENCKVNIVFLRRLKTLLKIIFPRFISKESLLLCIHTLFLVLRTFLSIYLASLDGKIVRSIVQRDVHKIVILLLKFLLIALPATFINSLIRFLENKLSLAFRTKLVEYFYKLYFKNQTYYRVENIDCRIKNVDQSLTDDIAMFSSSLAHLYSQLTKPFLDLCLMSLSLGEIAFNRGAAIKIPTLIAMAVVGLTSEFLRLIGPKFGTLVAEEAKRKGNLRFVHSRIIQNSEEIAFYSGHEVEESVLMKAYQALIRQTNKISCQKLWYVMIEQFMMKYLWSAAGMLILAIPILTATGRRNDGSFVDDDQDGGVSERTQFFTMAKNLLLNSASALERMITSYKEIIELSGYTSRVYDLLTVFSDVSKAKYVSPHNSSVTLLSKPISDNGIIPITANYIELIKVPIVTPNGDVVVPELSLRINPGDHILITGPNGCGKSSLFRIFHGLWPIYGGKIIRPPTETMYHIPQKPYMFLGTLRDQIIYPDTLSKMKSKGITDADLHSILDIVQLEPVISREGGLDAEKAWINVLSGGEKQRLGLARLFYHKPQFALLDECTSAISIDVESNIYESAIKLKMTLLTITHRPSLWKFHNLLLKFDSEGGWNLSRLNDKEIANDLPI